VRRAGYEGGITILRDHLRTTRPSQQTEAFFEFDFAPGEAAQVDWGESGDVFADGTWVHAFVRVDGCHCRNQPIGDCMWVIHGIDQGTLDTSTNVSAVSYPKTGPSDHVWRHWGDGVRWSGQRSAVRQDRWRSVVSSDLLASGNLR